MRDEEAVSSVIGTILMVLLVLILAAVLITWAMSFTEHQPENPIKDDDDPQRQFHPKGTTGLEMSLSELEFFGQYWSIELGDRICEDR